MNLRKEAIIFDYDGVVARTDPFNKRAMGIALTERRLPFSEDIYTQFFEGRRLIEGLETYIRVHVPDQAIIIPDLARRKRSFDSEYPKWIEQYDDTRELIERARGSHRLVIASGARRNQINSAIEQFNLRGVFEFIVAAEDYKQGKPAQDVYALALKKLGLPPEKVVVVEDSPSGIAAARRANIFCIAVTHTHIEDDLKKADLIVNDLRNIEIGNL